MGEDRPREGKGRGGTEGEQSGWRCFIKVVPAEDGMGSKEHSEPLKPPLIFS